MKQLAQLDRNSMSGNSMSNEPVRHLAREGNACTASPDQNADALEGRLDSWKEVAAYLRREVRTVQRWEKREGLPIHRHFHRKVGSIYAFKMEIDEWRRSRSPKPCALVSRRTDPSQINHLRLSRGQLESQATVLYRPDQSLWNRERKDFLATIVYVAPGLLTLAGGLKSLCLEDLLAIGASGRIRSVSDFAPSSETARNNKR